LYRNNYSTTKTLQYRNFKLFLSVYASYASYASLYACLKFHHLDLIAFAPDLAPANQVATLSTRLLSDFLSLLLRAHRLCEGDPSHGSPRGAPQAP
jgi:hypothetical protein